MAAVPTIPPIKGANAESTSSRYPSIQGSARPNDPGALGAEMPSDQTAKEKATNYYDRGLVTKNDMMAPKPHSDPIIATVGQRSARLLVSSKMKTEARTTKAVMAM